MVDSVPAKVLVTGPPKIGKSTVVTRLVQLLVAEAIPVGGFVTVEQRVGERRTGFIVQDLAGPSAVLAHEDLASPVRVGRFGVDVAAFERTGLPALRKALEADGVVVIDEVARMELACPAFPALVTEALVAPVPVVATDLPRDLERPRNPRTRTQTHHPTPDHRRHRNQNQQHHHRTRTPGRRSTPHPHPARPQTRLGTTPDQPQHRRRDRPATRPPRPTETADILNTRGHTSGTGQPFHPNTITRICRTYQLRPREDRLRSQGLIPLTQMAALLGVSTSTVKIWCHTGLVRGHRYNNKGQVLYQAPGPNPPTPHRGRPHDSL